MKNIFIILAGFLLSENNYAQSFEPNFLGADFAFYKGVLFKLEENPNLGFDFTFYSDLKFCQTLYNDNVIYPTAQYKFITERDSLRNRIFLVQDIIDKNGNPHYIYNLFANPILILQDTRPRKLFITGTILSMSITSHL